jgi:threonine dehydrogenase-like Zn-dependent dehydrogenase
VITHDLPLSDTPRGYELMDGKAENAIKVILTP